MAPSAPITLRRDTSVLEIPSGNRSTLPAGTSVRVMQSLGGSYTVYVRDTDVAGSLVRRDGGPSSPWIGDGKRERQCALLS